MVPLLIGGLLTLFCLAVVALPFLRRRGHHLGDDGADQAAAVHAWAVQELRTLEVERQVGEITQDEFLARREQLRLAAARALSEQAQSGSRRPVGDEALESEVLALRQDRARSPRCPLCSAPVPADAKECPRCGARFTTHAGAPDASSHPS